MSEHQESVARILRERAGMWSPSGARTGPGASRRSRRAWWSGPARPIASAPPVRLTGAGSVTELASGESAATSRWPGSGGQGGLVLQGLSEAVARRVRPARPRRENEGMAAPAAFAWGAHTATTARRARLATALLRRPVSQSEVDQG